MKKINVSNITAVWIDHRQLINDAYQGCTGKYYNIKKELFFFYPSEKNCDLNKSNHEHAKKRQIRRRSTLFAARHPEVVDLEANIEIVLNKLKEIVSFSDSDPKIMLERYWEEDHEFPKFFGANSSNEFQKFSFGKQQYLIPTQSKFFNFNVLNLDETIDKLEIYDLIVMDPPWYNKYIKRLKRHKHQLAYSMIESSELNQIPLEKLIHKNSLVAIWCTNAVRHQRAVTEELIPKWNLRLLKTIKWVKIASTGVLISQINNQNKKQPYETLYIACHKEDTRDFYNLKTVDYLFSVPSIIHSHKPPLVNFLQEYFLTEPKCLELFGRYLQPHFTSIGLEVLKLMDERLYEEVLS